MKWRRLILITILFACICYATLGCSTPVRKPVKSKTVKSKKLVTNSKSPILFDLRVVKIDRVNKLLERRILRLDFYLPEGQGVLEFSPNSNFKTIWVDKDIILNYPDVNIRVWEELPFDKNIPAKRKVYIRIKDYKSGLSSKALSF